MSYEFQGKFGCWFMSCWLAVIKLVNYRLKSDVSYLKSEKMFYPELKSIHINR